MLGLGLGTPTRSILAINVRKQIGSVKTSHNRKTLKGSSVALANKIPTPRHDPHDARSASQQNRARSSQAKDQEVLYRTGHEPTIEGCVLLSINVKN